MLVHANSPRVSALELKRLEVILHCAYSGKKAVYSMNGYFESAVRSAGMLRMSQGLCWTSPCRSVQEGSKRSVSEDTERFPQQRDCLLNCPLNNSIQFAH